MSDLGEGNGASRPPIFVVGFQRSGTTLLQSMLGAHPNIAAPPETHYLFRVANLADYFGDLRDDDRLRRALHEALHPRIPLLAECGFDEDELFERARGGDRSYAALLDVILSDFARRHGKRRWSEKTPDQPASEIRALFPGAQLVHIVRDPRDVVASRLETPWEERGAWRLAAAWRWFTRDAISTERQAGPVRFIQVRYEDLTSDPETVMRAVCSFLGEDYDPRIVDAPELRTPTIASVAAPWQSEVFQPVTASRQGRHRSSLRPTQRASVVTVARREISDLGYPPAPKTEMALGGVVKAVRAPARLAGTLGRARHQHRQATPEERYRETQRFVERAASHLALPPPAVSPDVYDEDYFVNVCAGSAEWRRSDGAEASGVYEGLIHLTGLAPGETLVDIGTGRGELLVAALGAGASRAVGVEYSEAAVGLARRTLAARGAERAEVLQCDARDVPLPDASADLVTFCDVVEHLVPAELAAAFAEARRLLRPGGRVFVHTYPTRTIYDVTYRALRLVLGRWRRWPRDPRNEYEHAMHVNEQTRASLRRELRRAGFRAVDVRLGDTVYVDFLPGERAKHLYRRLAAHRLTRSLAVANLFATARRPEEARCTQPST